MKSKSKFYTLIVIDDEKVRREGACDLDEIYTALDKLFANYHLPRVPAEGNVRIYRNGHSSKDFGNMWNANLLLRKQKWFVYNVIKWRWYIQRNPKDPNTITEEDLIVGYILPYIKNGVWEFKQEI